MSTVSPRPAEDRLETPVQFLKGVGPKLAETLAKLGLRTVRDVLYFMPRRYEDRRNLPPLGKLRVGEFATVRGRLLSVEGKPTRGGKVILRATIADGTGTATLMWFNQPWVQRKLAGHKGEILAYGQVRESGWSYEIQSPEYELIGEDGEPDDFARIVPVYPLSEGVRQSVVRRAAASAVEKYLSSVRDPLPEPIRKEYKLRSLDWCLRQCHQPESEADRLEARRRLVFEEFLYLQLTLEQKRLDVQGEAGIAFPISSLGRRSADTAPAGGLYVREDAGVRPGETLWDEVGRMLPFELTGAQRRVIGEIWADMERPHPMNRLLQGDVGSGKTAVAAAAMLAAVRCGYQAAIMAPTEILAEQHYVGLRTLFEPLGIEVELLVGKQSKSRKKQTVAKAKERAAHIVAGTHALLQEGVGFDRLGLAVVDEQHRFGVLQRAALRQKGLSPDVLVMTATPIPRTLAMAVYGDLDLSVLDELPPGRKPIKTHWRPLEARSKVYEQARQLVAQGRQVYVVCPMVSDSEKVMAQAAEDLYYRLSQQVYPDLAVGLLHGQMKPREKEEAMDRFRRGEIQILVSTTVIEVGVDVPNATAMIVEDANRFGLAQLHQLRGRVGRGDAQSYCILLADARTEDAQARMEVMAATSDGFKIAEEDLRLRGPGELIGTRQSGNLGLQIADLVHDASLLEVARQAAHSILQADRELARPEHRLLRERLAAQRTLDSALLVS